MARVVDGIGYLIEFEGDLKLAEVDDDVLRRFRDVAVPTLLERENHARRKYGTRSMKESIEAVARAGDEWPVMSAKEREYRLRWIASMFKWLHEQKWIADDPATILRGVRVQTKVERNADNREKNDRQSFTGDELNAIFSMPWYQTGRGDRTVIGKVNRKFRPFQYWLPMLGLLCGCRINEASQLWLDDVLQTETGTWYIDINEASPDKSLKTTEWSRRQVPLHPLIVEAGFPEWCQRLRAEGFRRVFPELAWDVKTRYGKEPTRSHAKLFLDLGMPRDNTKVFHSFRHNLNTALERMGGMGGLTEIARLRIMGHEPGKGVNLKHYLDDRSPDETIEFMRKVDFKLPAVTRFDQDAGVEAVRFALDRKKGRRRAEEDMGPADSRTPR